MKNTNFEQVIEVLILSQVLFLCELQFVQNYTHKSVMTNYVPFQIKDSQRLNYFTEQPISFKSLSP